MINNQLNTLVQIARVDGHIADKEIRFIKIIGEVNGVSSEEVEEIIKSPGPMDDLGALSDDQKFEYLYSVVQLMKADGQVFKSEIDFCEDLADRLGYKKKVIAELSSNIYSDPSITSDRERLKTKVQKYLI
jgi:uncharacterized tellurite resistance protein B-like protein